MNGLLKFRLVLAALVPGLLILVVRLWDADGLPIVSLLLLGLSALASLSLVLLIKARSAANPQPIRVMSAEDDSAQVPAYLLTYVFPFVVLDVSSPADAVAYAVFAALVVVLIFRTSLWKVNPLLLLAGYHTYVLRDETGGRRVLITKFSPAAGEVLQVVELAQGALKQVQEPIGDGGS